MIRCIWLIFIFGALSAQAQVNHWESIILEGDDWSYLLPQSQPAANWIEANFDDDTWSIGPSGFGYDDGDDQTIIPNSMSIYLRKEFTILDIDDIEELLMHLDYDDGFVAYLNGVEVARDLVVGNPPVFDGGTLTDHEAVLYQGLTPPAFYLDLNLLNAGNNILTIEVHNVNINSSDFSAIPFLSVGVQSNDLNYRPTPSWFVAPQVFASSNLPLVLINTMGQSINNQFKINAGFNIVYNGQGMLNSVTDTPNEYQGFCGIKIRGESSQLFDKKSFAVELWDENGEDIDSSFLNFPKEEDFILYGPYSDKTLLNNILAMRLANEMGHYSSRTRLVELMVNDDYRGIYVLMEKIKRDNDRVDIAKLRTEDISGDELTGGYIFRIDKGEHDGWQSDYNVYQNTYKLFFQYYYPSEEDIQNEQKIYISTYMDDFEDAVASATGYNQKGRHYTQYINLGSFVDNFLLNELSKDVDAYRLSTYFHKDKDSKGGKITAGPFWDFNLSFGNGDYCSGEDVNGWVYYQCPGNSPFWWNNLLQDPVFRNAIKCRWTELRSTILSTNNMNAYIDSMVNLMGPAADRNFNKWQIMGTYIWPNPPIYANATSYAQVITTMKEWIKNRSFWIDANINGIADNCEIYDDPNFEITATEEILSDQELSLFVFPNPSEQAVTITAAVEIEEILCTNTLGQLIRSQTFGNGKKTIDFVHQLNPGIYLLQIKTKQGIGVQELVVK